MAINKKTHVNASTILTKEVYEKVRQVAKDNKRSISSQIALVIEEDLERREATR